jgi:hypothetical protein
MSIEITSPFTVFFDRSGQPLDNGYIYIGLSGINPEVSPITVYWDSSLTTTAPQPIRTLAGYPSRDGSPGTIFISTPLTSYSIVVRDRTGALVYSNLTASSAENVSGENLEFGWINRQPSDPAAYETRLLVVETTVGIDNLGTFRNEAANPTNLAGQTAIRYQDYQSHERGAFGLGGDWVGNPYRYNMFVGIGNITGDDQLSTAKDTHFVVSNEHVGRTGITDQIQPVFVVSALGWVGLRGVNVATNTRTNAIYIDTSGKVGIGPFVTQPDYGVQAPISLAYTCQIDGSFAAGGDVTISGNTLSLFHTNTAATANERVWRSITAGGEYFFQCLTDAAVATTAWSVQRAAGVPTAFKAHVPVHAANGSGSLPSITFSSDTNTGLYWISANKFGLTADGALVADVDTSGINMAAGKRINYVDSQGTVGGAGGASALPGTPTGYIPIKVGGSTFVIPYYAAV